MGALVYIIGCVCLTVTAIVVNLVIFFLSYFFKLVGIFFMHTYNASSYLLLPLMWIFRVLYWVSFFLGGFIAQFVLWLIFRPEFYKTLVTLGCGLLTLGVINFVLLGQKYYPDLLKEPFEE